MNQTGKQYWRSLEQLSNTPQFSEWLNREFPEAASLLDSSSRRTMLKLMAASFGLAGLTACSRPVEKILPAAKGSEDYVPGKPVYYSTAMSLGGAATGLIVESHDGRPTKIEGNPEHPASGGACSAFAQASVLDLYDPDRVTVRHGETRQSNWDEFFAFAKPHFEPARMGAGEGLRFLSQTVNSPSLEAVRAHALAAVSEGAVGGVRADLARRRTGRRGAGVRAAAPAALPVRQSGRRGFARCGLPGARQPRGSLHPGFLPPPQSQLRKRFDEPAVHGREPVLGDGRDGRSPSAHAGKRSSRACGGRGAGIGACCLPALAVLNANPRTKWVAAVARDLKRNRERSIVIAGPRQPAEVHALAHLINHALGNTGRTVTYTESPFAPQLSALKELAAEMAAGKVATLVILGGNPVYDAPADLDFQGAMKKVPGHDPPQWFAERNLGARELALAGGALPRSLGRRAGARRHGIGAAAADPSALRRQDRGGSGGRAHRIQGPARLRHRTELLAGEVAGGRSGADLAAVPARRRCAEHAVPGGGAEARQSAGGARGRGAAGSRTGVLSEREHVGRPLRQQRLAAGNPGADD